MNCHVGKPNNFVSGYTIRRGRHNPETRILSLTPANRFTYLAFKSHFYLYFTQSDRFK